MRNIRQNLAFAFLYGVLHTLGPGHGKVVVVSYFVSRDARLWRGVLMGVQIAVTHVLSAVALFWLADLAVPAAAAQAPRRPRCVVRRARLCIPNLLRLLRLL